MPCDQQQNREEHIKSDQLAWFVEVGCDLGVLPKVGGIIARVSAFVEQSSQEAAESEALQARLRCPELLPWVAFKFHELQPVPRKTLSVVDEPALFMSLAKTPLKITQLSWEGAIKGSTDNELVRGQDGKSVTVQEWLTGHSQIDDLGSNQNIDSPLTLAMRFDGKDIRAVIQIIEDEQWYSFQGLQLSSQLGHRHAPEIPQEPGFFLGALDRVIECSLIKRASGNAQRSY
jgi:hypothetical protein